MSRSTELPLEPLPLPDFDETSSFLLLAAGTASDLVSAADFAGAEAEPLLSVGAGAAFCSSAATSCNILFPGILQAN